MIISNGSYLIRQNWVVCSSGGDLCERCSDKVHHLPQRSTPNFKLFFLMTTPYWGQTVRTVSVINLSQATLNAKLSIVSKKTILVLWSINTDLHGSGGWFIFLFLFYFFFLLYSRGYCIKGPWSSRDFQAFQNLKSCHLCEAHLHLQMKRRIHRQNITY